ncbi:retrovirus-related pol polyprotein from transposon TNT 1-94, partial [Tanacetum coccineum]
IAPRMFKELLVCVSASCLSSRIASEKLVVVTPMNSNRKVKFAESKSSTNASGSQPRSNIRNNVISRTSSSNKKNKIVEAQPRNVKSSLNKTNRVSVCYENVKHVVLNANSKFMDLCGPMRVESINGKKYILVIVDDYSRFTWVKFLRSKDETLEVVIKFLKKVQPPESVVSPVLVVATPIPADKTGTPSSTVIDQDALHQLLRK